MCKAVVEKDRPGPILLQLFVDLENEAAALLLIPLRRLLVEQLVDLGLQ